MVRVAVIPAAGEGVRASPLTDNIPKVLLDIEGRSLLARNIDLVSNTMGIRKFYVITGFRPEAVEEKIRQELGDREVDIEFIRCEDPGCGLAQGLLLARDVVKEPFVTVLGDELYLNSAHGDLIKNWKPELGALIGMRLAENPSLIAKNYAVGLAGARVNALIEKPSVTSNGWMGVGSYILSPEIFSFIEKTPPSQRSGKVELTDVIDTMAREREVHAFDVGGDYFNINTAADFREAKRHFRALRAQEARISVIVPALNEAGSIAEVVRDFLPRVHEVIVVDNQSSDGTGQIAREAGAKVLCVKVGGYGDAIRAGFDEAEGDIFVAIEADHSFRAKDLGKFVEYLRDADLVVGSRTVHLMIEPGTNMRGVVRLANRLAGAIFSWAWPSSGARFTDVGCTYRAVWRAEYARLRDGLTSPGPEFTTEMVAEALRNRLRIVEIPVSYYPRCSGESKHSKGFFKLARTATRMFAAIFRKRFLG